MRAGLIVLALAVVLACLVWQPGVAAVESPLPPSPIAVPVECNDCIVRAAVSWQTILGFPIVMGEAHE